ncbi:hypothetical protein WR25_21884 isoform I [Diploscapter pachys]|uniref:C-type lectin domain-containing protein n=1 Tax=Diploscapter pachys TaxID=2018661 RepID=A0A2A2LKE9_9BILA|nr:hypothetical protein WR25_21884 isoform I [Diploscapter pachys]
MRFWHSFYLVTLIFFIDIVKSSEQGEVTSEEDVEYRCTDFGFNWAAEIRCLRQLLKSCEENHTPSQRLRGARTIDSRPQIHSQRHTARFSGANGKIRARYNQYTSQEGEMPRILHPGLHKFVISASSYPRQSSENNYPVESSRKVDNQQNAEHSVTQKELEQKLAEMNKENARLIQGLEAKMNQYIRLVEEKSSNELIEMRRRFESEIKKINKRITLMSGKQIDGFEYLYMEERLSWYLAEEGCNDWGGHLASIHNMKTNNQLTDLIRDEAAWIGTNDVQKEKELINSDYSRVDFVNWKKGQPDNANHNEVKQLSVDMISLAELCEKLLGRRKTKISQFFWRSKSEHLRQ